MNMVEQKKQTFDDMMKEAKVPWKELAIFLAGVLIGVII